MKFTELIEKNNYLFSYKGHSVISTSHSAERSIQRSNLSTKNFKLLFTRMVDAMYEKGWENDSGEYLFYSKSLEQGIVVDYRKDRYDNSDSLHYIIITVLPPKKNNAKDGTKKVVVERYDEEVETFIPESFVEYLNSFLTNSKMLIENGQINFEVSGLENIEFYLVDKKIWDCSIDIIEID